MNRRESLKIGASIAAGMVIVSRYWFASEKTSDRQATDSFGI